MQVKTCGFPRLEDREKSVSLFSGLDYFRSGSLTKEETLRLAELEIGSVKDMFVVLSDVWPDNDERTIGNLETVLSGYENEEVVHSLFVFMGNFCSHPCNLSFNVYSSLRSQFGKLGQMIASYQRLKELSRFLFTPGPDDVGPSAVLPRCPLPKYITEELQKYFPNSILSNSVGGIEVSRRHSNTQELHALILVPSQMTILLWFTDLALGKLSLTQVG